MKKLNIFFLLLISSVVLMGQTQVSGNQSGVWALANSPYEVTGDITVPAGQQLTIEAGVEVNFQGYYKFNVQGNLQAIGTQEQMIKFTTDDAATGWHGIRLDGGGQGSHLQFCILEYGKTSGSNFPDQHGGAIMLNNSNIVVEDCVFQHNEATAESNGMGGAIYGLNTNEATQILRCTFLYNHSYGEGGAIKLSGDSGTVIDRCVFKDNSVLYGGGAICLYGCYDTRIDHCLFTRNVTSYSSGGAVYIEGYSGGVIFANSTLYDNEATGGDGGGVDIAFSDASFTNCIVRNNDGAYSDNVYLEFGYTEINYCDMPLPDGAEGSNNINVDPMFVDAANDDFHLLEGSPCIDAGIAFLTITDAYGTQITTVDMGPDEYTGTAPDMGAYEYDPNNRSAEYAAKTIRVFPNPARDIVYIDGNMSRFQRILISNAAGERVKIIENPRENMDVSSLPAGLYLLRFYAPEGMWTTKLLVR